MPQCVRRPLGDKIELLRQIIIFNVFVIFEEFLQCVSDGATRGALQTSVLRS